MENDSTLEITTEVKAPGITREANALAGGSTERVDDKLRILSIDGGGVRGIIPATILEYLEKELQAKDGPDSRLADYFDLIIGTSTGGLIAAMITTKRPPKGLPLSATNVLNFYKTDARTIFRPRKTCFGKVVETMLWLFQPKEKSREVDDVLRRNFGTRKLSEACANVIIPSFDIKRQQPVFFSSWETRFRDILVRDVCRATTAAPTFFSPVEFTVSADEKLEDPEQEAQPTEKGDTDKKADANADADKKADPDTEADAWVDAEKKADADEEVNSNKDRRNQGDNTQATFNMIDGGIAANNPTYVGVTQALRHFGNVAGVAEENSSTQLLVLSLGTGRHRKGYRAQVAKRWGVINWLRYKGDTPLINSLQNASADIVDDDLSLMFKAKSASANYLRIQTDLPRDDRGLWKLDNTAPKNLTKLEKIARVLLRKHVSNVNIQTGKLVYSSDTRNYQALTSFAETLRTLRTIRKPTPFTAT